MRGSTGRHSVSGAVSVLAALAAFVVAAVPAQADPPPFSCEGLPVDAFVADVGRELLDLDPGAMTHDALWAAVADRFAIGTVDCRLARLSRHRWSQWSLDSSDPARSFVVRSVPRGRAVRNAYCLTAGSSITATGRSSPPHREQTRTSSRHTQRKSEAQERRRAQAGSSGPTRSASGASTCSYC